MYSDFDMTGKQRAISLYAGGQLYAARNICLEICRNGKADAEVLCLLGVISGELNCFDDAERYNRLAVNMHPDYVDARYNLGLALRQLGRWEEARRELEAVLVINQNDPDVQFALGSLYEVIGEYPAALAHYRAAQQARPGWQKAIAGEAGVLEKQGDGDGAYRLIYHLCREGEIDGSVAVVYGRLALRRITGNETAAVLERVLSDARTDVEERVQLHFVLGALYDQDGDYAGAFAHYRAGNELKKPVYDPDNFSLATDRMLEDFSAIAVSNMPRSSCRSELPVFIVGMMRSGTSLVEQILSCHPAMHGAGELGYIEEAVIALDSFQAGPAGANRVALEREARRYLARIESMAPYMKRVIDKMPRNYFHLGYIQSLLPGARVIHCTRDPFDTCLSCYFQNFTRMHPETFDLEWLGRYYRDYRRLMQHWMNVLDLPVFEVRYEELVADPETQIRQLVEFCGLDWNDACLRHHENARQVTTASYNQACKPVYRNSIERWKNYESLIERPIN